MATTVVEMGAADLTEYWNSLPTHEKTINFLMNCLVIASSGRMTVKEAQLINDVLTVSGPPEAAEFAEISSIATDIIEVDKKVVSIQPHLNTPEPQAEENKEDLIKDFPRILQFKKPKIG